YWEFRELAEGDWELARKASGVRGKKTKRLVRRSSGVAEKLTGMPRVAANLVGANIRIVMVIVANKGGQLFHHISGYCQQRLVSGDRATTTIEGERFSQVRGLRLVATEEERLLAGVGVAIYHDRGAISRKCRGYDQSRQRWKIRLAL
ncbi:hypothetical protein BHE74_00017373, partial [Ensete ventricosum]